MKGSPVLGWDLDGVFVNFNRSFQRLIKQQTGIEATDISTWMYHIEAGVTKEQNKRLWQTITTSRRFYQDMEPCPGAPEALAHIQRFTEMGVPSYFITSRSGKEVHRQSVRWLESFGVYHPQVLVTPTPVGKALIADSLGLTLYVDDRPENLEAMAKMKVPRLFIVDAPYNQDFKHRKVARVKDVLGVLELITRKEKEKA